MYVGECFLDFDNGSYFDRNGDDCYDSITLAWPQQQPSHGCFPCVCHSLTHSLTHTHTPKMCCISLATLSLSLSLSGSSHVQTDTHKVVSHPVGGESERLLHYSTTPPDTPHHTTSHPHPHHTTQHRSKRQTTQVQLLTAIPRRMHHVPSEP